MKLLGALLLALVLSACASGGPVRGTSSDIAGLAAEIEAMSPSITASDAQRAAQLAYDTTHALALAYQISDPPLIHNAKVNAGLRPRGLCYHWAEDLEARLIAAEFETLSIKRAIANSDNAILIDHSTAVITAKGAPMQSGVVIDPWRYGGRLFWASVDADARYDWKPREDVLREKGLLVYAQRSEGSLAPLPAN